MAWPRAGRLLLVDVITSSRSLGVVAAVLGLVLLFGQHLTSGVLDHSTQQCRLVVFDKWGLILIAVFGF